MNSLKRVQPRSSFLKLKIFSSLNSQKPVKAPWEEEYLDSKSRKEKSNNEKTKDPFFLRLDRYDFIVSIYLISFVISLLFLYRLLPQLDDVFHTKETYQRFLLVYCFFVIMTTLSQNILSFKSIIRMILAPVYFPTYVLSFIWQLRKTFKKLKSNNSMKVLYLLTAPVLYVAGANSIDRLTLKFVLVALIVHIFISLYWGIKWSLSPFNFLKYTKSLKDKKNKTKFISILTKFDSTVKQVTDNERLKKIEVLKTIVTEYERLIGQLSSRQVLFICFLFVLTAVSTHVICGGTLILRAADKLAAPTGLIKVNDFFSGSLEDYLYITINTFLPSEVYGIEFVSNGFRWILTGVTLSSCLLLIIAIAGFSIAGPSKVEGIASELTKDMHEMMSDAKEQIVDGDPQKLLSPHKKKPY